MSEPALTTKEAVSVASTAARHEERRRTRRVRMDVPARVRPFYETPEFSGELLKVRDVSRNGFHFVSLRAGYRKDMNLYVACPAGYSQTPRGCRMRPAYDLPVGGNKASC